MDCPRSARRTWTRSFATSRSRTRAGRASSPSAAATAKLTGHIAGQTRTFSYPVTLPEREREHDFIPAMWASRKIGTLLEEIRLRGENAELKNEVIRLSKQYGIITPYTSFLVEEP